MGLWDGLDSAEVFDQGQYFPPGQWVCEIQRALSKRSRKSGQDLFIVECSVITSSRPEVARGARFSWCQGMKNRNVAMNAIYAFMLAIFDLPRDDKQWRAREFDPYIINTMDRVTGAENLLGGRMVNLSTWIKKTKEKDEDFTIHDWELFDYASVGIPGPVTWEAARVQGRANGGVSSVPVILSPDGRSQFVNGAWVPVQAAPPPPPPIAAPWLVPGTQYTPDGAYYFPPGAAQWIPMPPGARR